MLTDSSDRAQLRPEYSLNGSTWSQKVRDSSTKITFARETPLVSPVEQRFAPEDILKEMEFLRYVAWILSDGNGYTSKEIKQMWEHEKLCTYFSDFGNTKIFDLLSWRSGLFFSKEYNVWYTDRKKFARYIGNLHRRNEEKYGKDYEHPWIFESKEI